MAAEFSASGVKVSAETSPEQIILAADYLISNQEYERANKMIVAAIISGQSDYRIYITKAKLDLQQRSDQKLAETLYTLQNFERSAEPEYKSEINQAITRLMSYSNRDGKTALHFAVQQEKYDLVVFCVEHGADVNCRSSVKSGRLTPVLTTYVNIEGTYRDAEKNEMIRAYLYEHGAVKPKKSEIKDAKSMTVVSKKHNSESVVYDTNYSDGWAVFGKILLWIFFFPIMLIIALWKSEMHVISKILLTVLAISIIGSVLSFLLDKADNRNQPSRQTSETTVSVGGTIIDGDFQFEEVDGNYIVSVNPDSRKTISGELTIPESLNEKKITEIAENGFAECNSLTSVTVPNTVYKIGLGAFKGCNQIKELTLPFVGESESAKDQNAVLGYIFGYRMTQGDVSGNTINGTNFINEKPTDRQSGIWQYTRYTGWTDRRQNYFYYIPDTLKVVTITNQSVIPTAAFNGCSNLTSIKYLSIDGSDLRIGAAAFQGCSSLLFDREDQGTLTVEDRFSSIGSYAFADCKSIKSITVSDYVISIGYAAFKGCDHLESLTVPFVGESESAKDQNAVLGYIFGYSMTQGEVSGNTINGTSFINEKPTDGQSGTWQYTRYTGWADRRQNYFYYIPDTLKAVTITKQTVIPTAAFNNCHNLTSIILPEGYTAGACAFQDCIAEPKTAESE